MNAWTLRRVALAALLLALAACGGGVDGGDGDDPTPMELFQGPYHVVILDGHGSPAQEVQAGWGSLTPDGEGLLDAAIVSNDNGAYTGVVASPTLSYRVDGDRTFVIPNSVSPFQDMFKGGMSQDGSVAAAGAFITGLEPMLWLLLSRAGTFDASTIAGTYYCCAFGHAPGVGNSWTKYGTLSFDGTNGWTSALWTNNEVTVTPPAPDGGTYAVAPDGTCTLEVGPGESVTGGILEGGDLIVLAGVTKHLTYPVTYVMVRQSAGGATDALLEGHYFGVGFECQPGTPTKMAASTGHFESTGAGTYTVVVDRCNEGVHEGPIVDSGTYAVNPKGRLDVTPASGDPARGGVSPDGRFAVVGGGTTAGSNPILFFLVR